MIYLRLPAMLLTFALVCSCRNQEESFRPDAGAVADSEDVVDRAEAKVQDIENGDSIPSQVREQMKRLNSDRATDRAHAAMALAELGKEAEAAIPLLMTMLTDEAQLQWQSTTGWRGEVTTPGREAAIAVGKISQTNAQALLEVLDQNRGSLERSRFRNSIVGLGYTKDQRAVTELLSLLDNEPELAAVALGQIGDPRAIPALIEVLRKINRDVEAEKSLAWSAQREVVLGLTQFQDPRAVDVLIEAAKVSDAGPTAKMAAEALGKLGDRRAVDVLIGLLGTDATAEAATALGEIGDQRAIEPLIGVVEGHWADWVKDSAAHSLRLLTGENLSSDPRRWRHWFDQNGGGKQLPVR